MSSLHRGPDGDGIPIAIDVPTSPMTSILEIERMQERIDKWATRDKSSDAKIRVVRVTKTSVIWEIVTNPLVDANIIRAKIQISIPTSVVSFVFYAALSWFGPLSRDVNPIDVCARLLDTTPNRIESLLGIGISGLSPKAVTKKPTCAPTHYRELNFASSASRSYTEERCPNGALVISRSLCPPITAYGEEKQDIVTSIVLSRTACETMGAFTVGQVRAAVLRELCDLVRDDYYDTVVFARKANGDVDHPQVPLTNWRKVNPSFLDIDSATTTMLAAIQTFPAYTVFQR